MNPYACIDILSRTVGYLSLTTLVKIGGAAKSLVKFLLMEVSNLSLSLRFWVLIPQTVKQQVQA